MGAKELSPPPQRPYQDPRVLNSIYSARMEMPFGPNTEIDSFRLPRPETTAPTAVAIRPDALVLKDTITLTPQGSGTLGISFQFIAKVKCAVVVYQFAEEQDVGVRFKVDESRFPRTVMYTFAPTDRSQFPPNTILLDPCRYPPNLLEFRDLRTYPLVLAISPQYPDPRPPQSHLTYVMYRREGQGWKPVVVKQIFMMNGVASVLQDIYGMQGGGEGDVGEECVVCLTERKNVAVMPCRHVCLCQGCAAIMLWNSPSAQKCPICRGPILNYMNLKVQGDAQ